MFNLITFIYFYVFHLIFSKFLSMIPIREILSPPSYWWHSLKRERVTTRTPTRQTAQFRNARVCAAMLPRKSVKISAAKLHRNDGWKSTQILRKTKQSQVELKFLMGRSQFQEQQRYTNLIDSSANLEPSREGRQNIWPCFQGVFCWLWAEVSTFFLV